MSAIEATDNPYLAGNFAPVDSELTAYDLPVTGQIPPGLNGRLLRIGPNPIDPDPQHYHWFLGSGMVHGLRLNNGKASWYKARYVRDDIVVEAQNWPPVAGPSSELQLGSGVVNTNVLSIGGVTTAVVEAGNLPVELSYDLDTVARTNLQDTLPAGLSAHPHRDPDSGDLHVASYSPFSEHLQYLVINDAGRVSRSVDIPRPGLPMVHDCMFTRQYFIVLDLPVVFNMSIAEQDEGFPYRWDEDYGARVGLLPRDGDAGSILWHEVSPCYVFHVMNAYETPQGQVVIDVVRHPRMFHSDTRGPNEGTATLVRWSITPGSGTVSETLLDGRGLEFPRIDERLTGKPYRYGYTCGLGDGFSLGQLCKHDLQRGTVDIHSEGEHRHYLEPVFVPASDDAGEDDGWIMAYVYDRSKDSSDVVILAAQDFSGEPVATIHLPRRVPFGFHGNWLPDGQ